MYKLYTIYPILLLVSAFGPYLSISLGVKTDNLVTYSFGLLFLFYALTNKSVKIKKSLLLLFVVWVCAFLFLLLRTLAEWDIVSVSAVIAECKNFTQPIAILMMFLFTFFMNKETDPKELIRKSSWTLVILLSLNTIWIFIGFFIDQTMINQYFWRGDESVASRAMTMGRYSGIFNQPMEAGAAYCIGLFAWLYLAENRFMNIRLKPTLLLILLVSGGLLTVSKVFLFGGLIMFLGGTLFVKPVRIRIIRLTILVFLIGFPIYYYLLHTWDGINYLFRFFGHNSQQQGLLNLLTAGRYGGSNSQQSDFFSEIFKSSPIYGEGLGSQQVLDSGFFHFFANGGLIGLGFYLLILLTLCYSIIKFYFYTKFSSETKFFIGITLLVIIASFGSPVFTLNRSSVILWLFIGLLLNYLSFVIQNKAGEQTEPVKSNIQKKKRRLFKKYKIVW
ncbi:hypothetical protein ACQKM1_22285 [Peribacillus frigoritolerans]|uniref:hypothetical protein n=1 Tax=Peribacillus frigoritolerans TaxID=450367 RepID=UPI003CFF21EE